MTSNTDLVAIWRGIEQAGSIDAYINTQLKEHGFLVARSATDNMSKRELTAYKADLKKEAAEKRRLKKETWKAYKQQHIVHLGTNVYWNDNHDWDKWDVENAEARIAENGLPPLGNAKQLAEALNVSIAELRMMAYHRDVAKKLNYIRFTIPKRDGSERAIWAPLPKLKNAQHWILQNILEKMWVHGAVHGFLAGRSIYSNALRHTNSRIILKMDLRDFFPTVTLPRVRGLFRKAGYREQVATLLALLCTEAPREIVNDNGQNYFVSLGPRCLPQGAPTSPAITNALSMRLDRRLTALANKRGWRYTRYADDLTFSLPMGSNHKPDLKILMGLVKKIVGEEGFQVHPDKTRVLRHHQRQKVTGLVVNGKASPRVSRKKKRELRAAIHNLKQGKPLRENESLSSLQGYAAYIAMSEPALGQYYLNELAAL